MNAPVLKIKVLPKPVIKGKMDVRFPARVQATSPLLLDTTGGVFTFSLDINALQSMLLPWGISLVGLTQRVVTGPGAVSVLSADADVIIIAKTVGAATTINLPTAASRISFAPTGKTAIRIVDGKYDAAINNITILPNGSEKIMGGSSYIIDSNGASITLTPLADGSGWV